MRMNLKALAADIKRQQAYLGIDATELAASASMCRASLFRKLRNPEQITLGELQQMASRLRIKISYELD